MTKKRYSASLKSDVDKLDIDKIKPVLDNLCKISNVVEKEVVKKLCWIK